MANPTATYIGNGSLTYAGAVYSAAGVGIGAADANRRVVIAGGRAGVRNIVSATIGGISATIHVDQHPSNTSWAFIISAVVPTGTTADVEITMDGTVFSGVNYGVYTINNSEIGTITTGVAEGSGSSIAVNFSQTAGGCCIGTTCFSSGSGLSAFAVSGYTLDFSLYSVTHDFHLDAIASTGTGTATTTWTGTAANVVSGVVAFAPVAPSGNPHYAYAQQ